MWDQDPILMRDFRLIKKFEFDWKNAQHEIAEAENKVRTPLPNEGRGAGGIGNVLNQYIQHLEEEDAF